MKKSWVLIFLLGLFLACQDGGSKEENAGREGNVEKVENAMEIKLKSSAFDEGGMIPAKYTCDGEDISPPLAWSGVPESAKSLALISDDPDAPVGTWVHWVLYNVPAEVTELPENMPPTGRFRTAPGRA